MSREDEMIEVLNQHKGELLALQCMTMALLRALPHSLQTEALRQWDIEKETAKTVLLNSPAPEQLLKAFDWYAKNLDDLRTAPPEE